MNILKKFFLIILFFFLSTSISNSSEKIAFIDVDYILNNSNLGKSILKELEKVNNENFNNLTQKEQIIKKK
mgnify:CR=1 FL=1